MSAAWSHLPNAVHIDRILASVKEQPIKWNEAYREADASYSYVPWRAAWDQALDTSTTWDQSRRVAYDIARDLSWSSTWEPHAYYEAYNASCNPILALMAWDDCVKYLDLPCDKLKVWSALSEDPACVLLLPAVIAFERIAELKVA
jgi:hypothetical protein